jgi:hypothetical protein
LGDPPLQSKTLTSITFGVILQEATEENRLIRNAGITPKKRTATKPTKASKARRLEGKTQRGQLKVLRGKVGD